MLTSDDLQAGLLLISMVAVVVNLGVLRKRRRRRFKVRPMNRGRTSNSVYEKLVKYAFENDRDQFFKYTRMTPEMFDQLLSLDRPYTSKDPSKNPITAEQRLALTLHFLAEGCSMQEIAWNNYIGITTAHYIIKETCTVLWDILQRLVLPQPSQESLETNKKEFLKKWNIPNCIGALDGKQIENAAFPLHENIMRPYSGCYLPDIQNLFNMRLSRARRCIENAFGILAQRWRRLRSTTIGSIETCEEIVKAVVVLHNYIQKGEQDIPVDERRYCPTGLTDWEDSNGVTREGEWRKLNQKLRSVGRMSSNNASRRVQILRNSLAEYFSSPLGTIKDQWTRLYAGSVPTNFHMQELWND